jgi:subtilisin family serine protease
MHTHSELAGNKWVNPYDATDGVDNDGNQYVDDVNGWDFAGNDNTVFDGAGDDHGTHVAGTIAGRGGNGAGVAGVCWNLTLISAKFLGNHGGTTANAIKAVDYLTDLKTRHGINIVASNNSWGGGGFSQALQDAIERANAANILFVAAAGNESTNIDATPSYPAGYPNANIISVAAIDKTGALASFSNYGATKVHLGAPGVAIVSTVPVKSKGSVTEGYASYSGTSMATPHVTGAAAMYASSHPGATAAQIKAAILSSVVPTPSLAGKTITGGRLNVSGF